MPPPSYPHRHLLLTNLLDEQPDPPQDAFAVGADDNVRGCKLDALLLAGWSISGRKAKPEQRDALQHADNLRLKKGDFEVIGRIGEGQFGTVRALVEEELTIQVDAVRCKLNGQIYAMKTMEKNMVVRAGPLASSNSPVPSLIASFQAPTSITLVTDFAPCGSLWDRMCEMPPEPGLDTGKMPENEVRWWARQMVSAIAWLHGMGYAHRDIKPHNFLLLTDGRLWLTDFGSAAPARNGIVARKYCVLPAGTPDYVAPEVLKLAEDAMVEAAQSADESMDRTIRPSDLEELPGYSTDVDWWSLGATLYEMAVGRAPFWSPSIGGTYERIIRCDVRMPDHLSPHIKSLLSGSSDVRLGHSDVSEIRKHPFFFGVDWTKKPTPAPQIAPQPIDLGTLAESFMHDFDDDFSDVTFDHFFNSSPGITSFSMSMSVAAPPAVWERWVGWSWDPPADFFGEGPPVLMSPTTQLPIRQHSAPPASLFTPLKGGLHATPGTAPRTAPRSCPRTRPVSERQAYAQLVQCVQASARKKIASSTIKVIPSSVETASSQASVPWGKEQPPTPTPMSRDTTTGRRSRTPSLMSHSSLTSRSRHSRTASRSSRTDETFLSRLTETTENDQENVPSRPVSRLSGISGISGVSGISAASTESTKSAGSAKGLAPPKRGPTREPLSPLAAKAKQPPPPYIAPTDPGGSDRLSSLETWHRSLEESLTNLEQRLGYMQSRYPSK
ncbi:cAMP-dependent protein kinase [Trichosporon asahii var. asahii CBS 2479]|uniref:cAMP-dependent protein kinase n=1 Tax=Trichosporon asahii var. asahii (strain ATCC 90039 / CBS 2479 / JCM 2466 / KCTC 7840 / NBRC 103889/ NCYC 2677 / UAMH 7654) TaxID=1186058 RepID=J6EWX5_TRIAS|nr:cAMP-dependent protein kinase [Trichosporon asahii var. asahii CBS 2479]EJT47327.1 cAMP-dependent protein kinase [Trichosporon asahii var. asahii CBS 2479]